MNIQQLRAQIAALQNATMDENKNFRSAYDEGKFDALSAVDALLDSLQKEQDLRCGECAKKSYDKGYFDGHIHDGDRIVHVDGRKVNVSRFRRVAKPLEAPVSEDLEEEIQKTIHNHFFDLNGISIAGTSTYATVDDMVYIAKHFANWQKEQFEKNRLAACDNQTEEEAEIESDFVMNIIKNEHRQPTFDDAIKYGMRLQEEQMMAKAIDGEVGYWNLRGLSVNVKLPRSVKEGDKVKVLVVKED